MPRREQLWSLTAFPLLCCSPPSISVCLLPTRLDHESHRFGEAHLLLPPNLTPTGPGSPSSCQAG